MLRHRSKKALRRGGPLQATCSGSSCIHSFCFSADTHGCSLARVSDTHVAAVCSPSHFSPAPLELRSVCHERSGRSHLKSRVPWQMSNAEFTPRATCVRLLGLVDFKALSPRIAYTTKWKALGKERVRTPPQEFKICRRNHMSCNMASANRNSRDTWIMGFFRTYALQP